MILGGLIGGALGALLIWHAIIWFGRALTGSPAFFRDDYPAHPKGEDR